MKYQNFLLDSISTAAREPKHFKNRFMAFILVNIIFRVKMIVYKIDLFLILNKNVSIRFPEKM